MFFFLCTKIVKEVCFLTIDKMVEELNIVGISVLKVLPKQNMILVGKDDLIRASNLNHQERITSGITIARRC